MNPTPALARVLFQALLGGLTVVVAHPHYLKVRLFGDSPHYRYEWETHRPMNLRPDLLQDWAALCGGAREEMTRTE